jgi:hypothetical protein
VSSTGFSQQPGALELSIKPIIPNDQDSHRLPLPHQEGADPLVSTLLQKAKENLGLSQMWRRGEEGEEEREGNVVSVIS